jgi:small GTP-binding protein
MPRFRYDIFLCYSSEDVVVVRKIAERLRRDGLRVFFADWESEPSAATTSKIEKGLQNSRVLVLFMSANAFGSEWDRLESYTLRFRDPRNTHRRFIPVLLDDSPVKQSLANVLFLKWEGQDNNLAYAKLLDTCKSVARKSTDTPTTTEDTGAAGAVIFAHADSIYAVAMTPDGKWVIADTVKSRLKKIAFDTPQIEASAKSVFSRKAPTTPRTRGLAVTPDGRYVVSCSSSEAVQVWSLPEITKTKELKLPSSMPTSVAISSNGLMVAAGFYNGALSLWNLSDGRNILSVEVNNRAVKGVAFLPDGQTVISASEDGKIYGWDTVTCKRKFLLQGHDAGVTTVTAKDGSTLVSGSHDKTIRIWDLSTQRCTAILEGHTNRIYSIAIARDSTMIVSGSADKTIRVWDLRSGRCLTLFRGHTRAVRSVLVTPDQSSIVSSSLDGTVRVWPLTQTTSLPREMSAHYSNAKVLLVGDSGAGKTGLSQRLALNTWNPTDSTVGAWATQWKLPLSSPDSTEREIWLWDFGGQADQRLIHQLYMEDTALAVLVFDGQKENIFEALGHWDRDVTRASTTEFTKLLVAGRVDASGLRASRNQIESFAKERGYIRFLETSAKANIGCDELKAAIVESIDWNRIPWRSSPVLFRRLREEIIRLKDSGRVLMRFNELRETLQIRLVEQPDGQPAHFTDKELKAVVSLLAGPGVVWELSFGSWVLLQPERINAYAQAVIQTMREDEHERGCLLEERILNGHLTYHSSIERLEPDDERFVLLAMHQTLVERGLCLREQTEKGPLLIFPSYYRRERPELVGHPAVLVSYRFNGFLDDIYATLVVRLHHTKSFEQAALWRYAADFKTLTGKQLGVKLTRRAEGAGELEVFFDPIIPTGEKIIFIRYIHEHLQENAADVVRLRHYVCPHCGTPAGNREVAMKKLEQGKKDILCINCDDPTKRIPLWDELEELFASSQLKETVRNLRRQSEIVLDNADKERTLVGEVISIVSLAGQICRELTVSDNGIDMEIEFKSDTGEATARKLYLQLKSGDSYLRRRMRDGSEVFRIKNERHARYWMGQAFPVYLVVRTSDGEIRWMEIRDWLRHESDDGQKVVSEIVFSGERFDVLSVRRKRDLALK